MRGTHFSPSKAILGVCLLVSTIAGARPAGAGHPPACAPSQVPKVFAVDKGFKLLLIPLSGVEDSDAALGVRVMQEMKAAFPAYLRRMSRPGNEKPWQKELSLASLDCTVSEHAVAEKVGRTAGADAVLWGRAVCLMSNPKTSSGACRLLPLGFLDGPLEKIENPLSELKLSLTLVHHELSAWGHGVQEANPLRTVDFAAQNGQQSYGLLNEVLGVYAYLAEDVHTAVMNLQMARETVTGGARGQAELDLLIGYIATQSGALPLAQRTLERALSECGTPPDACQASALYLLAMVDSLSGDREQAVQRLTQALGLGEQIKDPRRRVEILSQLGGMHAVLGDYTLALHLFEKVQAQQEALHDAAGQAKTLWHIARFHRALGKPAAARGAYEQAAKLYHQAGDTLGEISALIGHAGLLLAQQNLAQAETLLKQAEALEQATRDPGSRGRILSLLAEVFRQKQEPVLAIHSLKEAVALAKKAHDLETEVNSELELGEIFQTLEDHEQALEHLEAALPLYTRLDSPQALARTYWDLGWSRLALKQSDGAVRDAEQARKYAKQLGDTTKQLESLSLLSQIYLQQPETLNAKERLQEGLKLARELHDDKHAHDFLYCLGALHALRGDGAAAVPFFQELRSALASIPPSGDYARYYPMMALVFAQAGRTADAVDSYRRSARAAHQSGKDDEAAYQLRLAIDVAFEGRQLDSAESLFAELHDYYAVQSPLEIAFKARLLSYRGAKETEAAYNELAGLAGKSSSWGEQTVFRSMADAGLLRLRQKAHWGRCPGVVVNQIPNARSDSPLKVGDIVVALEGKCTEGAVSFDHLIRQNSKVPRLTVQIWRDEKRQTVSTAPQKLAADVVGF